MTPNAARSVGLMCARTGHEDVIDVHVALCATERGHAVITSAPSHVPSSVSAGRPTCRPDGG
jgi:hypothetical protein